MERINGERGEGIIKDTWGKEKGHGCSHEQEFRFYKYELGGLGGRCTRGSLSDCFQLKERMRRKRAVIYQVSFILCVPLVC